MGQRCVRQTEYVSAVLHGSIFASAVAVKSGEHAAKCRHSRPKGCSQEAAVPGILVFSCFADACELLSWLPSVGQNIGKWSILLWVAWKHFCRRSSTQVRRVCRQMSLSSAQGLLHNAAVPGMLAYFCVVDTCVELSGLAGMAQSDRKRSESSLGQHGCIVASAKAIKSGGSGTRCRHS